MKKSVFATQSQDVWKGASSAVTLKWEGQIAVIDINDPSKTLNAFTRQISEDISTALDKIFAREDLGGVVITSSKPNCFAAGVDISIFDTLTTQEAGETASRELHALFKRFADAKVPTVAAVNGVCLGGGTELSLACHYRVCSNHPSTQFGLPEIQIGLIPGGGGTQRLPRLIGITASLDLILTGKKVDAKKALKLGLVDDVVPENQLLTRAVSLCLLKKGEVEKRKHEAENRHKLLDIDVKGMDLAFNTNFLENNFLGRTIVERKALEQVQKNTKGKYPAALKCVEAVFRGISKSLEKGLALESKLFGEMVVTPESRSLVHIFRMMTAAKKNPYDDAIQGPAKKRYIAPLLEGRATVGVLGAGLMGSGIATVLSDKNIRSVMLDRDGEGVGRGLKAVASYFDERARKRRIKRQERDAAVYRVVPTTDYKDLRASPIVVEAVFEDLRVKHDVLKRVEAAAGESDFIFATNTSSLPIKQIAAGAAHPENVVGMHFFSPVPKMPLVEIIVTKDTRKEAASAVYELGLKMGKNIIVVNDGPGFYTTRILAFLIIEALLILSEGASIEDIDDAMEDFGFPVGPITLLDEVGIDVSYHITNVLVPVFGDRLVLPKEMPAVIAEDRKGRKNGKGFYTYQDGKKGEPDSSVYAHFEGGSTRKAYDKQIIKDRCALVFINEAVRCLDEGILQSEDDGDMGAVFGLGFPPFLGGPFHYIKTMGKKHLVERLKELSKHYGKRFEPGPFWSK